MGIEDAKAGLTALVMDSLLTQRIDELLEENDTLRRERDALKAVVEAAMIHHDCSETALHSPCPLCDNDAWRAEFGGER